MSHLNKVLGDQRTGQRGKQRILVLVHGIGSKRAGDVVRGELVGHVDHFDGDAAEHLGLLGNLLQAVVLLAHIAEHGDDVETHLVLQPFDADGGIEAARIGKYDFSLETVFTVFMGSSFRYAIRLENG